MIDGIGLYTVQEIEEARRNWKPKYGDEYFTELLEETGDSSLYFTPIDGGPIRVAEKPKCYHVYLSYAKRFEIRMEIDESYNCFDTEIGKYDGVRCVVLNRLRLNLNDTNLRAFVTGLPDYLKIVDTSFQVYVNNIMSELNLAGLGGEIRFIGP